MQMKLTETIIKYKDDYVIIRFDPNEKDIRKYNRSEYRTWSERKSWVNNAKIYWHEDDAAQALVKARILAKWGIW